MPRLRAQDLPSPGGFCPTCRSASWCCRITEGGLDRLVAVPSRQAQHPIGVSPPYPTLDGTRTALRFAKIAMSGSRPAVPG